MNVSFRNRHVRPPEDPKSGLEECLIWLAMMILMVLAMALCGWLLAVWFRGCAS